MSQVLLLSVRFDDDGAEEPSPGLVTVHHPFGRRFLVTEITDGAAPDQEIDPGASIW